MHVLILSNLVSYTYNFRKELIDALVKRGDKVTVVADNDDNDKASDLGCELVEVPFDGKGTSVGAEFRLLRVYKKIIRSLHPDVVLSFTIKMNLYGGMVCRFFRVPYYPMITGLGELSKKGKLQRILLSMYRFTAKKASCVFFQNMSDIDFFDAHRIRYKKKVLVPGSGVNLDKFEFSDYPPENPLSFAFVGRVTKAKGIEQFLDSAEVFKDRGYRFYVAGKCDSEYEKWIQRLNSNGIIKYLGVLSNTKELFEKINCLVLPTYHPEGMSNVLLEAGAVGRPCICTDRPGCREIIEDGVNGLFCKAKDEEDLQRALNDFSGLPLETKKKMGIAARKKVQENFDRQIVVNAYLEELNQWTSKK